MLDPFYKKNNQKPQTMPAEVLGNMTSASPLKPSISSSMQNSVMQSGNTGSPSSHDLMSNGSNHTPQGYAHNKHNKFASSTSTLQSESTLGQLNTMPKQGHTVRSNHSSNTDISSQPTDSNSEESNSSQQISPIIHLSALEDLDHGQWRIVQAHWEQLEEMEALFYKEGTLLCQQPEMAFGEYVHKLEDIMERKARCVHSMLAQLRPYLKPSYSNQPHNQEEDNHHPIT
ncbi:uncharacterized protein LOC121939422 [Plectropomus leopardus]|uniref:uncharacterized protein LOC121939148 n=1 Tax=Plectropomus leopardus TaxID=160734 RepID=UPI001C4D333C|nr:uncharacterized protein LOC121939148 [Plectropomus leopardus]XP_042338374.1 uncharacterized protein LOC121939420 [Plectropomus leopardus]XP_042338379.1 uncharacterized protein LOC121939422 [Plectropomus leopardus]